MKTRTIFILGIIQYILSVIASATDNEGNYEFPIVFIAISGIATIIFIILATIRLWKKSKIVSIILLSSIAILYVLQVFEVINTPSFGSPLVIIINALRVIYFCVFIWVEILLWKMSNIENHPR